MSDIDYLQSYLDGTLSPPEVTALEKRLKVEPALAQLLLTLAEEEAVLHEWSAAHQAEIRSFSAGIPQTNQATIPSNRQGLPALPAMGGSAPRPQEARTMLMQANCPGCRSTLRIPAGWMHQPIRCKHCGMVIQLQQKAAVAAPPPAAIPVGRAAAPMGQMPPAAIRAPMPPPAAIRVPPPPPPAAIRVPPPPVAPKGTYDKAAPLIQPRAHGSSPHKAATIAVWLVGLVVMAGTIFAITQFANQLPDADNIAAVETIDPPPTVPEEPKPEPKPVLKKRIFSPPLATPVGEPAMPSEPKEEPKEKPKEPPAKTRSGIVVPTAKGDDMAAKPSAPPKVIRPLARPPITPPPAANTNPAPQPRQPAGSRPPRPIDVPPTAANTATMPRRLLSINPNNYLYYNPIGYGSSTPMNPRDTHQLVVRLTDKLAIPPSQVTEISDGAPSKPVPPLKAIVEKALTDFCESSRAQDRIIVLYSGHAVEIEDELFLVPIEGEGADKDSLIPLKSVFELLSKSKARQKVLIMDVCRFNTSHGAERPDSGKMGEKLDKALAEPPAGVQIWSACVKDQNSCEVSGAIHGGLFFNALLEALASDSKGIILPLQNASATLPLTELSEKVNKQTEADAKLYAKSEQTPRLAGEEITEGAAPPNPAEPAATPVKVDWQFGAPIFGVASKAMIEGILKETADIPPVKVLKEGVKPIRAETLPTFSSDLLKGYKAEEPGESEFRKTIVKTTETLKRHAKSFREDFQTTNIDMLKTEVQTDQKSLATTKLELEEALEEMTAAGEKREEEKNKRWQANYDYVLSRLKMRIAYVFEYQYMLSEVRTDALPERPEGSPGWRLASREKMQCKGPEGKEAKKHVEEAKKLLEGLGKPAAEGGHAGTPWQVFGKREMYTNLGLEWQAIGGGMAAEKADKK